jgi:hypothetical protein
MCEHESWLHLAQDKEEQLDLVKNVMDFQVPQKKIS